MGKLILGWLIIGGVIATFTSTPQENEERITSLREVTDSVETLLIEDKTPEFNPDLIGKDTPEAIAQSCKLNPDLDICNKNEFNDFDGLGSYSQLNEVVAPIEDLVRINSWNNFNNEVNELNSY